jgi:hypothetical protein
MGSFNRIMLAVGIAAALAAGPVQAQTRVQGVECGVEREVRVGALTEGTYNRLSRYLRGHRRRKIRRGLFGPGDPVRSIRRDEYEQSIVLQAMGHVRMQQERPAAAMTHFQQASRAECRCRTLSISK